MDRVSYTTIIVSGVFKVSIEMSVFPLWEPTYKLSQNNFELQKNFVATDCLYKLQSLSTRYPGVPVFSPYSSV